MSTEPYRSSDVEIDVRALFRALLRAMPVIVLILAVVGVGSFFALTLVAPRYSAEARVLIEKGESLLTRPTQPVDESSAILDEQGVSSQVQLIRSRDLALKIVKDFALDERSEFNRSLGAPSLEDRLKALIGLAGGSAASIEEGVLDEYYKRLTVYAVERTRVIAIEFYSEDPQLAARIANAVAQEFLTLQREAKRSANAEASRWLESEIQSLRTKVSESEAAVEKFRSGSDLFVGGQNASTTLASQQLSELSSELSRVRAARAEAEAKADQIRAGLQSGTAFNSPEVLNSGLIQRLVEQQVALRARIAELSATMLPGHPRIKELQAQLADLGTQIRAEAQKILKGLESEGALAGKREQEIMASLSQLKAAAARSGEAEVGLRALQREAAAQRELLETYLARYREALARQGGDYLPADARIISTAAPAAEPYFPKKTPLTTIIVFATAVLISVFILLRELASGRPMRQVAFADAIPTVPNAVTADARLRWEEGGDVRRMMPLGAANAGVSPDHVESALGPIRQRIMGSDAERILVTHAEEPESGRPRAAVALARSLARAGRRVVLVDLSGDGLDRIAMGERGELPGFTDLYRGEASFSQVIFRDRHSPAHFIPAGLSERANFIQDDERFATILEALDHTYDHVVVDTDPATLDSLAPSAGAIVLVSERDTADPRTLKAHDRLKALAPSSDIMLVVAPAQPASMSAGEVA